jgi:hypothetical protein
MFMLPKVAVGGLKLAITEREACRRAQTVFCEQTAPADLCHPQSQKGGGSSPSPGRGTLHDDPALHPAAHIIVASKAPWFTISDGLPQYEEHMAAPEPGGDKSSESAPSAWLNKHGEREVPQPLFCPIGR